MPVESRVSTPRSPVGAPIRPALVVMHHPRRRAGLARLVTALGDARPAVVVDPDPTGPPSPLRTAKRAWAAVDARATHHVVLQDDVAPIERFTEHLRAVIAARPDAAVALYVNWRSPHNAYLARWAALTGRPFADLAPHEYVPTLGLALPSEAAIELSRYLSRFPDDFRDDDELVTGFCLAAGLDIVACVPHLLDHLPGSSVAGNDHHGARHAAVPLPAGGISPAYWQRTVKRSPERRRYTVDLYKNRCYLRFVRAAAGEPAQHPYSWPWANWCGLIDAEGDRIRSRFRDWLDRATKTVDAPPADLLELWAACYLTGRDAGPATGSLPELVDAALGTLVRSGVPNGSPDDLLDLCRAAADLGREDS
ncbi:MULTISPECIES: hypothetical protein [unclassified Streptomyces]|uniref:hypothetical protein n=1 Tax=unclassified Streptomyces TaxID=2593676 RepID=UPI0037A9D78D